MPIAIKRRPLMRFMYRIYLVILLKTFRKVVIAKAVIRNGTARPSE